MFLFTVTVTVNAVGQSNTANEFLNTSMFNDGENADVNAAVTSTIFVVIIVTLEDEDNDADVSLIRSAVVESVLVLFNAIEMPGIDITDAVRVAIEEKLLSILTSFSFMAFNEAMVSNVCVILLFTSTVIVNRVGESKTANEFLNTSTLKEGKNADVNAAAASTILVAVVEAVAELVNEAEVSLPTVAIAETVTTVVRSAFASVAATTTVASQPSVKLLEGAAAASAV
jgi:hypothetical protein